MRRGPGPSPSVAGVDNGAWRGPHSVSLPVGGIRVCVPNHGPKFTQGDPMGPQHAEGSREPPLLVLGASQGRHRDPAFSLRGKVPDRRAEHLFRFLGTVQAECWDSLGKERPVLGPLEPPS